MNEDDSENSMQEAELATGQKLAKAGFKKPRLLYLDDGLNVRKKDGSEVRLEDEDIESVLTGISLFDEEVQSLVGKWHPLSDFRLMSTYNDLYSQMELSDNKLENSRLWFEIQKIAEQMSDKNRIMKQLALCYDVRGERLEQLYAILNENTREHIKMGSMTVELPFAHYDEAMRNKEYTPKSPNTADTRNFFGDLTLARTFMDSLPGQRAIRIKGVQMQSIPARATGRHFVLVQDTPVSLEARLSCAVGEPGNEITVIGIKMKSEQFCKAMNLVPGFKYVDLQDSQFYESEQCGLVCEASQNKEHLDVELRGPLEQLETHTLKIVEHLISYNAKSH